MDIILAIIGLLLILVSILFAATSDSPIRGCTIGTCFIGIILYGVGVSLSERHEINKTRIPAIEVYRGNTTLEITYRDSIPVDSVVVYKEQYGTCK